MAAPQEVIPWDRLEDQGPVPGSQVTIPNTFLLYPEWANQIMTGEQLEEMGKTREVELRRFRSPEGIDVVRAFEAGTDIWVNSSYCDIVSKRPDQPKPPFRHFPTIDGIPLSPLPLASDRPGMFIEAVDRRGNVFLGPGLPEDSPLTREVHIFPSCDLPRIVFRLDGVNDEDPGLLASLRISATESPYSTAMLTLMTEPKRLMRPRGVLPLNTARTARWSSPVSPSPSELWQSWIARLWDWIGHGSGTCRPHLTMTGSKCLALMATLSCC